MPNPEFQHFRDGNVTYDVSDATARQHILDAVTAQAGIHGIRYYNQTLAYYDTTEEDWVEIETGSGGIIELTAAEFAQLSEEDKNKNVLYVITDALDDGTGELTGIFTGTHAQWNQLSDSDKAMYSLVFFTDDYETASQVFTGATTEANGTTGLVPAPLIADKDKYLKGDGTWAEAATDDNFVGTTLEWNGLTANQKAKYKTVDLTDDFNGIGIDNVPTENSQNVVRSGGVASTIGSLSSLTTTAKTSIVSAVNEVNSAVSTLTTSVGNKNKVTSFEVSTSSWTEDTTSQSGTTLYKKSISLNNVYVSSPSVDIGSTGVLPSSTEQDAYNLLQYVTCDDTVPCLYLYASDTPSTTFYINVRGCD